MNYWTERDRADRLARGNKRLRGALEKLIIAARTTGGTAGRDPGLVEAIEEGERAIEGKPTPNVEAG